VIAPRDSGTMRAFTFDKFRAEQVHPIVRASTRRDARHLMSHKSRKTGEK